MNYSRFISASALALLAANASLADDVSFSGFISNGYLQSSANNYLAGTEDGTFEFAEAGINATWSPARRTTLRGQLFTFELGPYGNFDPILDFLFVDYNVSPEFGFRLGRVKRAEGIYTDIQDIDIARPSVLLPIGMYDPRYRDFSAAVDGLSLYGNLQLGQSNSIDYTAYHGKIDFGTEGGVAGYALTLTGASLLDAKIDSLESDTNSGIQLWWNTATPGLRLGLSHSIYKDISLATSGTHPIFGVPVVIENDQEVKWTRFSAEYYVGDWTLTSEYNLDKTTGLQRSTVAGAPGQWENSPKEGYSWYLGASRRFLQRFEAGAIYARYFDSKNAESNPTRFQKDLQFSIRYDATDNWSLKLELHDIEGTARVFNQYGQNASGTERHWTLFAAKSTFSF